SLTDAVEEAAWAYIKRIDEMGGSVKAVEERFMQREIEDAAYRYQREVEREERVIVGVNRYTSGGTEDPDMELHTVDETIRERQKECLADLKDSRDNAAVEKALARLKNVAAGSENLLYPMREALAELATLGEVSDTLRGVFGEYRPS
nr:methylmalonyl-CoA mutase [Rubrobacteraceae bacterium]